MRGRFGKILKAILGGLGLIVSLVVAITLIGFTGDKTILGEVRQAGEEALLYFSESPGEGEGNAWDYYARAMEGVEGIAPDSELIRYLDGEEAATPDLLRLILNNLPVIGLIEEGAHQERCVLPHDYEAGMESPLPEYTALRRAVIIACVKALYDLENGRSDEALQLLFSTMMVGKHIASSPMLIDQMIGFALLDRPLDVLKIGIASRGFDHAHLEEICGFLDDMEKHWPSLAESIRADIKLMRISFAKHGEGITPLMMTGDEASGYFGFIRMLALRVLCWHDWFSPVRAMHSSLTFFEGLGDDLMAYESMLLADSTARKTEQDRWAAIEKKIDAFGKRNFWFALTCPEYPSMFKRKLERITVIRLVNVSSSVAAYRSETGQFPRKLEDIAPHLIVDLQTRKSWEYTNYGDSATVLSPGTDGDTAMVTITTMGIGQYLQRRRLSGEQGAQGR